MIVNTIVNGFIWTSAGPPDASVHTSDNQLPNIGDLYFDYINSAFYRCLVTNADEQVWKQVIDLDQTNALIAEIPQANWTQSNPSISDYIKNKPSLATVATSGSYNDLSDKPTIPSAQVQSDWTQGSSGAVDFIKNKPSIPAAQVNCDWNSSSGVSQLLNKPSLATVATSGSYNDLSNKPSIPAAQVNSDWNAVSGVAQILNKPSLATVATTGAYADLSGKPSLATVATTGSYNDLSNKPTIPAAQVQSDWTQTSTGAVDYIKNKPVISFSTPTFSSSTTSTQLSSTRATQVIYTYPTSMTTLLTSQSLTATLQYADDSGFTTNIVTVNSDVQGCSGILSLVLSGRLQVQGIIPAGKYRKVILAQTGGATVPSTLSSGQEVLL